MRDVEISLDQLVAICTNWG